MCLYFIKDTFAWPVSIVTANTFTDIRRKEWQNGEMVKLEKLEKDIEMYYWPNYVR